MSTPRRFRYVGPGELLNRPFPMGLADIASIDTLDQWLTGRPDRDRAEPFTYVVTVAGILRLAPRQCEHVACAGGADVLGAGEIQFAPGGSGWAVVMVSNQSTGYCPDLGSWAAVAAALDRIGVRHPGGFTHPIAFRVCATCDQINVVRDGLLVCAVCGDDLAEDWNIDQLYESVNPDRNESDRRDIHGRCPRACGGSGSMFG